jgi:hypothetical protein
MRPLSAAMVSSTTSVPGSPKHQGPVFSGTGNFSPAARSKGHAGHGGGGHRRSTGQGRAPPPVGPSPVSDRDPRGPPRLRTGVARLRSARLPCGRHSRHRPAGAACRNSSRRASQLRPEERPDLRALARSPAPDQFPRTGGPHRRHRHREQVRPAGRRQARLQPDQLRAGGHDAAHGPGVGLARPVGQRGGVRVPPRLGRRAGREPRGPERRDPHLPRRLRRAAHRPIALARRAPEHPPAPGRERRARALRLLHDLGSEDHARLASRSHPVRHAGGRRRVGRPVQALPDERAPVVARPLLAGRPAARPAAPGPPLHLGPPDRPPDHHERRTP